MTDFLETLKDTDFELRRIKSTFDIAKKMFELIDRNRKYLEPWLLWVEKTQTPEDEYNGLQHVYNNEWTYLIFKDEKIIGSVGFTKRDETIKKLEMGYMIDQNFSGRGITTQAIRLLEKLAFETDEWNKIEIRCDVNNIKSQNIPKRLNYNLDGILREDIPYASKTSGDAMIFSKLKSEWNKKK